MFMEYKQKGMTVKGCTFYGTLCTKKKQIQATLWTHYTEYTKALAHDTQIECWAHLWLLLISHLRIPNMTLTTLTALTVFYKTQ